MAVNPGVLFGSDPASSSSSSLPYWSGFMPTASTWVYTANTLSLPSSTSTNTLTKRVGNITVAAAASSEPGISWTPSSITATYEVTTIFGYTPTVNATSWVTFVLYDLANTITIGGVGATGENQMMSISGLYTPGTASAVTVNIYGAIQAGLTNATILNPSGLTPSIEWKVVQIAP